MSTPADDDMPPELEDEGSEDGEDDDQIKIKAKKKAAKKKLIRLMSAGLVITILIGTGTAFFMGFFNPLLGIEEETKTAALDLGTPVSHEFPQIKSDLKTGVCRSPFLRTTISVQLSEHDLERLQESQDRIVDQLIVHLREQERQDLVGKAGSDQLRFDIVNIVNHAIAPARIHGVIFKEFVLQ